MHRTQIYLQDALYTRLKARSTSSGVSISELIRRAVAKELLTDPMDDAQVFFDRLEPLASFAEETPEEFVRALRSNSRIILGFRAGPRLHPLYPWSEGGDLRRPTPALSRPRNA